MVDLLEARSHLEGDRTRDPRPRGRRPVLTGETPENHREHPVRQCWTPPSGGNRQACACERGPRGERGAWGCQKLVAKSVGLTD